MEKIGFIGLGNMGLPMAINLVKAGYQVNGFDTKPDALKEAALAGIKICHSSTETVKDASTVITMLPDGAVSKKVNSQIIDYAHEGTVFIDCSTIDIDSSREVHEKSARAGMVSLDAPVSGGVVGAENATLTFMVGGDFTVFERRKTLLLSMGKKAVYCGEQTAGQIAKTCNNMLLGITMIGVCEAFSLAGKLGLDMKALYDVVSTSTGQCWSVTSYCPIPGVGPDSPADNGYMPGFSADLMLKDLDLALKAAITANAAVPLGKHATSLYQLFVNRGQGGTDFSGIFNKIQDLE